MINLAPLLPLLLASQQPLEDLDALDARISAASNGSAARLDRRLRLARCAEPPEIESSMQGGLELACPSRGWRFRVPIASPNTALIDQQPILVKRGESVQVAIVGNEFTLHYQAIATEAGRLGDTIRVKFTGANGLMASTVSGHGKVRIVD
ncbi:flagella basal body P-ring formation protein FlgA [Sphingorhabdus sp.]|uniref:flagella basal body P-ring formation protein FlgA n=1 Tax=Sphingorhabdus sp. TaxID=1902408 RepID=UPI0032B7E9A1